MVGDLTIGERGREAEHSIAGKLQLISAEDVAVPYGTGAIPLEAFRFESEHRVWVAVIHATPLFGEHDLHLRNRRREAEAIDGRDHEVLERTLT